ncbi:MAG: TCR/Tet family MFS transporter [Bacteroidota bacterium]
MKTPASRALLFIFITLLLDVIGMGIIMPVIPDLIRELTGEGLSAASKYSGWLLFCYAFMQFLFSPILGGLSDRFGRRPVILFSLLGLGIDYVFMAWAPGISWLFLGRILAGISGASFTAASSYIADISTPEKRAQNFGMIGMAFGLGFIIGPLIGGVCSTFGSRAPFLVASCFTLLNLLYGYFVLPESLEKENRRKFEWKRANPIGSLIQLKKYPVVSGMVASLILIYIAAHAVQSNWGFYTMFKFNWTPAMVGYSLTFVGVLIAAVQGGLIRIVIPKFGQKKSVYIGLLLYAAGFILFAFATKGWMMYAILIPYCLGGIAGPALQGIISTQVPSNAQGELQGGLTSLMSVTSIVGPLMMNYLFAYFTMENAPVFFPGAPFILAGILTLISSWLAWRSLENRFVVIKDDAEAQALNAH